MIHIQKSHEILRADTGYAHDHARGRLNRDQKKSFQ